MSSLMLIFNHLFSLVLIMCVYLLSFGFTTKLLFAFGLLLSKLMMMLSLSDSLILQLHFHVLFREEISRANQDRCISARNDRQIARDKLTMNSTTSGVVVLDHFGRVDTEEGWRSGISNKQVLVGGCW